MGTVLQLEPKRSEGTLYGAKWEVVFVKGVGHRFKVTIPQDPIINTGVGDTAAEAKTSALSIIRAFHKGRGK